MKSVRKRLTYANVMSSIAVFLVVAGGSALAATNSRHADDNIAQIGKKHKKPPTRPERGTGATGHPGAEG